MHDTREDLLVTLTNPGKAQYRLTLTGERDERGNACAAALIFDAADRNTGSAVVDLAREYGWTDAPVRLGATPYEDWDIDHAEDYLNELTLDGYSFGFSDEGDFFLGNDAWWEFIGS